MGKDKTGIALPVAAVRVVILSFIVQRGPGYSFDTNVRLNVGASDGYRIPGL